MTTNAVDDCAQKLSIGIIQCILYDQQWRTFGFKRTPRRGSIWEIFINPERLKLETFLIREFGIIAFAITCLSLKNKIEKNWQIPIVASILSTILGDKMIRDSFHFNSINESFQYFEDGVKAYLMKDVKSWNGILIERSPKLIHDKLASGVFLGAALLFEPTKSIFPHLTTSSTNICANRDFKDYRNPLLEQMFFKSATNILIY